MDFDHFAIGHYCVSAFATIYSYLCIVFMVSKVMDIAGTTPVQLYTLQALNARDIRLHVCDDSCACLVR